MDALVVFIPVLPLISAALIGLGILFGVFKGEFRENLTADIALWAIYMSSLLSLSLLTADILGKNHGMFNLGYWIECDSLKIPLNFMTTGFNLRVAVLFSILLAVVFRFSVNYMHREAGYYRFFFILSLFSAAMLYLVLSANAVGTFLGWEIAGLCSYLLIAYAYERPVAVHNATRVFVTNRLGDAGFIIGIGLCYSWAEGLNWIKVNAMAQQMSIGEATTIALCFSVAAFAKSAQIPFAPWLSKAMEGPTPSSAVFYGAVMVHSGVYLVILLQPLFEQAPLAMICIALIGFATACYSYFIGLTQTDVKSSLVFATSGQLGLMFFECGLGFWQLAEWHLCAHAVVRCYQFLSAPSLMHHVKGNPIKPFSPAISRLHWAYVAAFHRFWLEQLIEWSLVKPVGRLGQDLAFFDDRIIDRMVGSPAPAIRAISSLAELEEWKIGARLNTDADEFGQGSGFAGKLTVWFAGIMHWFEIRFVLRSAGKGTLGFCRQLGHGANQFEQLIIRPRYLVLFVIITLLVAF